MSSLCLCCIIKGEDIVFPVGVSAQARVFALKKEIQRERDKDTLQDVGPHTLELWKPRDINGIAAEPRNTLIERIKSMGASLSDFAEELGPTRRLSDIFTTEPSMDHIQIVVTTTEFLAYPCVTSPAPTISPSNSDSSLSLDKTWARRPATVETIYLILNSERLVQVRGTPGSGKTILLKLLRNYISKVDREAVVHVVEIPNLYHVVFEKDYTRFQILDNNLHVVHKSGLTEH